MFESSFSSSVLEKLRNTAESRRLGGELFYKSLIISAVLLMFKLFSVDVSVDGSRKKKQVRKLIKSNKC